MDFNKLNKYLQPILENPSSKKWSILKLERGKSKDGWLFKDQDGAQLGKFASAGSVDEPTSGRKHIREPLEFRDALKNALRPMFKSVVYVKFHDNALWAAIDLVSVGLKWLKTMIFMVHYPHAEFVFVSSFKNKAVQISLHEALCDVFDCEQVRVVNCKGSDLTSLADMALHPLSQGTFGAYRLYKTIVDSKVFDDDDVQQDKRRRVRAMDRAAEKASSSSALMVVSPSKARRFQQAPGLGHVVDESKGRKESTTGSGLLTKEERERVTAGTSALNEVKMVVDHDLQWGGRTIAFSCTLVIKGSNIIKGISQLHEKGMVEPGEQVAEVVADASNVISDAFAAREKKKARKRKSTGSGEENEQQERKMVRTVAVKCM